MIMIPGKESQTDGYLRAVLLQISLANEMLSISIDG